MPYALSIIDFENQKVINFANKSKDFVEVVFTIDGKEVKEGEDVAQDTKGYAYPPMLEKPVKKTKAGFPLQFNPHGGEVVARIFAGQGSYKDEDIDKPAFLRHKLVDKIRFKRTGDQPIEVLMVKY